MKKYIIIISYPDHSSLTFAARSFVDPFSYLNTEEDKNKLDEYETYLTGVSERNPGFKVHFLVWK